MGSFWAAVAAAGSSWQLAQPTAVDPCCLPRPVQLLVSYAALFAIFSPAPVWDALSYAGVTPGLMLILLPIFQPPNGERAAGHCDYQNYSASPRPAPSCFAPPARRRARPPRARPPACAVGTWPQAAYWVVVGSLLGGGMSIAIIYATWAANGGSYEDSVTKAATFVCLLSLAAGLLNMARFKWHAAHLMFICATLALVLGGSVQSYWSPYIPWKAPLYYWAGLGITLPVVGASSWFVFPILAGRQYRVQLSKAFSGLALVLDRISALMRGERQFPFPSASGNDPPPLPCSCASPALPGRFVPLCAATRRPCARCRQVRPADRAAGVRDWRVRRVYRRGQGSGL